MGSAAMGPLLAMGLLHLLSCATATAIPPTDNSEADIEADQAPLQHSTERKTMFSTTTPGEEDDDAEARGIGWQPRYMILEGSTYASCQGIYYQTQKTHDNLFMWERIKPDNTRWLFWDKSSGVHRCTSSGYFNAVHSGSSDGGFISSAPAGGCYKDGRWQSHMMSFGSQCVVPAAYAVDWSAAGAKAKQLSKSGYALINGYSCNVYSVSLITTEKCNKGYPDYDPEGQRCGSYDEGYCSYAFGDHTCAKCN